VDGVTLDDMEEEVASVCSASSIIVSVSLTGSGLTWVRIRAYLRDGSFIESFYNDMTGKTFYALITNGQRIFGADNTDNWHWHPFENPEDHLLATGAIGFQGFLNEVEAHYDR
jgi:hypothetical protein